MCERREDVGVRIQKLQKESESTERRVYRIARNVLLILVDITLRGLPELSKLILKGKDPM